VCRVGSDQACRASLGDHGVWNLARRECACAPGFVLGRLGRCVAGSAAVCRALKGPAAIFDGAGACICPPGFAVSGSDGACVSVGTGPGSGGGNKMCAATLGTLSEYDAATRSCRCWCWLGSWVGRRVYGDAMAGERRYTVSRGRMHVYGDAMAGETSKGRREVFLRGGDVGQAVCTWCGRLVWTRPYPKKLAWSRPYLRERSSPDGPDLTALTALET
jgi:hypothetical protein